MAPSMLDRSPNPTSGEARLLVEDGDLRASHCGTERYDIQAPTGGAKQPQTALHVHHLDGRSAPRCEQGHQHHHQRPRQPVDHGRVTLPRNGHSRARQRAACRS